MLYLFVTSFFQISVLTSHGDAIAAVAPAEGRFQKMLQMKETAEVELQALPAMEEPRALFKDTNEGVEGLDIQSNDVKDTNLLMTVIPGENSIPYGGKHGKMFKKLRILKKSKQLTKGRRRRRRRHSGHHSNQQPHHSHHIRQDFDAGHGFKRRACQMITSYEFKTKAKDIFGHEVKVMSVIAVGQVVVDQFFHETYCAKEDCNCAGINTDLFTSSCETTYGYTYARVLKNGDVGWTYIKVRTGCGCSIQETGNS